MAKKIAEVGSEHNDSSWDGNVRQSFAPAGLEEFRDMSLRQRTSSQAQGGLRICADAADLIRAGVAGVIKDFGKVSNFRLLGDHFRKFAEQDARDHERWGFSYWEDPAVGQKP